MNQAQLSLTLKADKPEQVTKRRLQSESAFYFARYLIGDISPLIMDSQTARMFLANMPDDVFNIYIAPLIEAHGWPFNERGFHFDRKEGFRWRQMFDLQSVETIRQLSWERREIPFSLARFHPRSYEVIAALIKLHVFGVNTFVAPIADSDKKIFRRSRLYPKNRRNCTPLPHYRTVRLIENEWHSQCLSLSLARSLQICKRKAASVSRSGLRGPDYRPGA